MFDAIVGAVIMVVATTGLVFAVEVGHRSMSQAGRYPLTQSERTLLQSVGLNDENSIRLLQQDLDSAPLR